MITMQRTVHRKIQIFSLAIFLANIGNMSLDQYASSAPVRAAGPALRSRPVMRPANDAGAGRDYSARLWNRILNQWDYPNGNNHVTLTATLAADGNVESVQLSSSPKSAEAEASAQSAFDKAKPLDALPKGMTSAKLTILFNSKSDPHGDSSSGGSVRLDPINSVRTPVVQEARPEVKQEVKQEAPAVRSEIKTETKPEPKPEPQPEQQPIPEIKVEPKVEPETKIETKIETESKSEVKTEPKIENPVEPKTEDEFGSGAGSTGK